VISTLTDLLTTFVKIPHSVEPRLTGVHTVFAPRIARRRPAHHSRVDSQSCATDHM